MDIASFVNYHNLNMYDYVFFSSPDVLLNVCTGHFICKYLYMYVPTKVVTIVWQYTRRDDMR
jgi:hypothetical protein